MNVKIKDDNYKNMNLDDEYIIIAVDITTGIKITNRGQLWMNKKWNLRSKKGYLKIHVPVDIKTRNFLYGGNR